VLSAVCVGDRAGLPLPVQNFLTGKNRNLGFSGSILTFGRRHVVGALQPGAVMLPYWMELSAADVMQGTALLATVVTVFSLQFVLPAGR